MSLSIENQRSLEMQCHRQENLFCLCFETLLVTLKPYVQLTF